MPDFTIIAGQGVHVGATVLCSWNGGDTGAPYNLISGTYGAYSYFHRYKTAGTYTLTSTPMNGSAPTSWVVQVNPDTRPVISGSNVPTDWPSLYNLLSALSVPTVVDVPASGQTYNITSPVAMKAPSLKLTCSATGGTSPIFNRLPGVGTGIFQSYGTNFECDGGPLGFQLTSPLRGRGKTGMIAFEPYGAGAIFANLRYDNIDGLFFLSGASATKVAAINCTTDATNRSVNTWFTGNYNAILGCTFKAIQEATIRSSTPGVQYILVVDCDMTVDSFQDKEAAALRECQYVSMVSNRIRGLPGILAPASPALATAGGGTISAGTLNVVTTWISATGCETAVSPATSIAVNGSQSVNVTVGSLPTTSIPSTTAVQANVYAYLTGAGKYTFVGSTTSPGTPVSISASPSTAGTPSLAPNYAPQSLKAASAVRVGDVPARPVAATEFWRDIVISDNTIYCPTSSAVSVNGGSERIKIGNNEIHMSQSLPPVKVDYLCLGPRYTTGVSLLNNATYFDPGVLPSASTLFNIYDGAASTVAGVVTTSGNTINTGSPAVPSLAFTVQPSNVVAGATFSVTVSVMSGGVVAGSDTSAITLTTSTGAAISGTATANAIAGVATFTGLSIAAVNSYTLTATAGIYTPATSKPFSVSAPVVANNLSFSVQPSAVVSGVAISPAVVVRILYPSGALASSDTSVVTISGTSVSGTLVATAVGGVAIFGNLVMGAAGKFSLTATSPGNTPASSAPFTVTAAVTPPTPPNVLSFTTQPGNAISGASIGTVAVSVMDPTGVTVQTADSSTVITLASSTTVTGTLTATASSGVATYTGLTVAAIGTFALSASASSKTPGSSMPFVISAPAIPNHLFFSIAPTDVIVGSTITPSVIVQVMDSTGAIVTGDTSTVTLAMTGLAGTLSRACVAGAATFNDLTVSTAGRQIQMIATDGSYSPATSPAFNATAPAPIDMFSLTLGALNMGSSTPFDPTTMSLAAIQARQNSTSVGGYLPGEDPATLLLNAVAEMFNLPGSVGEKFNEIASSSQFNVTQALYTVNQS